MKRRQSDFRQGDLRVAAALFAIIGLAVLLNQPNPSTIPPAWVRTWTDSEVLRLNLPEPSHDDMTGALPSTLPPWPTATPAIHEEPVLPPRVARATQRRDSQPAIYQTPITARPKFEIP